MARPVSVPFTFGPMSGTPAIPLSDLDADFAALVQSINDSAGGYTNFGVDTGSTNNFIVSITPAPLAYVAGMTIVLRPLNTNTGASVINVNGLGNAPIQSASGSPLTGGEITSGIAIQMVYSGSAFLIGTGVSGQSIPVGSVQAFSGSTAPAAWGLCDGLAISRSTYPALFAVVGTTFGVGDGSTTFNKPDCRGRLMIGAGAGPGLTNRVFASKGGGETHTNSVNELAAHTHGARVQPSQFGVPNVAGPVNLWGFGGGGPFVGVTVDNAGSGVAYDIMNPWFALNYIIKLF